MELNKDDEEYTEFELCQRNYNYYKKKLNYRYFANILIN